VIPTKEAAVLHEHLPVCVDLPGRLGHEVTAFAEAEAGWQVVAADSPLVPVVTLAGQVRGAGPTVVVLDEAPDPDVLRDTLLSGALDIVVWPHERHRLLDVPGRIVRTATVRGTTPLLTVGGARGGVGASTVALTIAATVAWAGGRALCVGDDATVRLAGVGPWQGPGTAEVVALGRHAAQELPTLAREVPGVPGLAVLGGGGQAPEVSSWPYDLVVADLGAAGTPHPDVLVAAADGSAANADAQVLLVVEHGPLNRGAVTALLGRAPDGWLPYSHRVARAGVRGRVPSALPGSWVAAVRAAMAGALRQAGTHPQPPQDSGRIPADGSYRRAGDRH
jgi:hypothetical protein